MSDLHRPAHVPSLLVWGGWYGSRNVGDTAILLGLKQLVAEANPGGEYYIRVLSTDPDYTSSQGVTGQHALVKREAWRPWAWLRILRIFSRPDLVVVSGGTPLFDSSHAIRTLYLTLPLLFRVPFVVFGAGVKPLRSRYGRASVRYFLRRARSVTVRDEDSAEILQRLGVPGVQLTADSAFFARPAPPETVDRLLAGYGIQPADDVLVVAPRLLSTERKRLYLEEKMAPELIAATPAVLAEALERVAERFDRVVLMAMHFHGPDSDVPFIRKLLAQVKAPNVTFVDRELRPELAIGLFRRAQLVVGIRLHALLLAASMGTPPVGIAYEAKVHGLYRRLGLEDYCLDLFRLNADDLVGRIDAALKEEPALRQHLARRVAELRDLVLHSARTALRVKPNARGAAGRNA